MTLKCRKSSNNMTRKTAEYCRWCVLTFRVCGTNYNLALKSDLSEQHTSTQHKKTDVIKLCFFCVIDSYTGYQPINKDQSGRGSAEEHRVFHRKPSSCSHTKCSTVFTQTMQICATPVQKEKTTNSTNSNKTRSCAAHPSRTVFLV